jgi:hypothetical protein
MFAYVIVPSVLCEIREEVHCCRWRLLFCLFFYCDVLGDQGATGRFSWRIGGVSSGFTSLDVIACCSACGLVRK